MVLLLGLGRAALSFQVYPSNCWLGAIPGAKLFPWGLLLCYNQLLWLAMGWSICCPCCWNHLPEIQCLWLSPNDGIHRGVCEVTIIAAPLAECLAHVTTCGNDGSPGRVLHSSAPHPPVAVQSVTQQKTWCAFHWVAAHSSKKGQLVPSKKEMTVTTGQGNF